MSFTWRFEPDDTGVEIDPLERAFPSQSEAESWIGEHWHRLAGAGVTTVELFEGARPIYDMSLSPD